MAVVCGIALGRTYSVCIVTGRAWSIGTYYMYSVPLKTLVIKDAVSLMTFIAKCIVRGILLCVILGCVVLFKQVFVVRTMRPLRSTSVIIIVTVCTEYYACCCIRRKKTRDI